MVIVVAVKGSKWPEATLLQQITDTSMSAQPTPETIGSISVPSWRAYVPVVVASLLGVLFTWVAYRQVTDGERQRVESLFLDAARDRVLVVQRELKYGLAVVEDVGSLFDASRRVGRRDFRNFVGPALRSDASIQALEWAPRVGGVERNAFVTEARRSFPPFRITELGAAGERVGAAQRSEYFPVLYVQPYQANKARLGFDLASDEVALSALRTASTARGMVITAPLTLHRDGGDVTGFTAYLPVYSKDGPAKRGEETEGEEDWAGQIPPSQAALRGFALGSFRVPNIIERALESLSPGGIDIAFYDVTDANGDVLLYRHVSRLLPAANRSGGRWHPPARDTLVLTQTFDVMNRRWKAVCTSLVGHYQVDPWSGWAVLAGGLAFTGLLAVYLTTVVGREGQVRRLVADRTLQLVTANEALNKEIAERRRAEQELQALNDTLEQRVTRRTAEAERRAQELEQFAYVASHDLKAPLRAIGNLAAWIAEDLDDRLADDTREQLDLLRDRVGRMHALIEGLLAYSRVGRVDGSVETVDTAALVAEVVDSLAPPAGFVIDVAPDLPVLQTDRLQLGQVFANLLSNSVKHHGGTDGHIWVGAREQGNLYEFSVADDGPGIPAEYHDKVFLMFQTLQTRDFNVNTGIGLALVKKIVQERGGDIILDSDRGKGATFRFTWPRGA